MYGLFIFDNYYPLGGLNDLEFIFTKTNELESYLDRNYDDEFIEEDNIQIYDFKNKKVIIGNWKIPNKDEEFVDKKITENDGSYYGGKIIKNRIINKFEKYIKENTDIQ